MIDAVRGKKRLKIYTPYYNKYIPIVPDKPSIYNSSGDKMDLFFIRDRHFALNPYCFHSTYYLWDRFNYSLDTHFYTGNALKEIMGSPLRRYAWLIEPRSKQPKDYLVLEKNRELSADFTNILTHDARLLEILPNAIFFPSCASSWVYDLDPDIFAKKTKMISILSSRKKMCSLHYLRIDVARQCKKNNWADTFGTFDDGKFVSIAETLKNYRYTIAFENEVSPLFFTERITSSFITMTVPIYLGAERIGDFFNMDGIIQINTSDALNISDVLKQCSAKDYESRLPAILDNYQRALKYLKMGDFMYETIFGAKPGNAVNEGRNFTSLRGAENSGDKI